MKEKKKMKNDAERGRDSPVSPRQHLEDSEERRSPQSMSSSMEEEVLYMDGSFSFRLSVHSK